MRAACLLLALALPMANADAADVGNRLAYLEEGSPYHVGRGFPKLVTPQWVGEEGVEAVVVLAVDDMGENAARYEAFLRPILDRLKAIDGRAPVSIMTCRADPRAPELRRWLAEGVNLDVHTLSHPCPLLRGADPEVPRRDYHGCVDRLHEIPGNRPVAFRMPCCDSQNTVSPRFFAEIFNRRSPGGHFLSIDSSVFNITTANDPDLPRSLVLDAKGGERFRAYLPFPSFVNTIEDYPYPYVIGGACWEFPCAVPSDWEAQNLRKPNHPLSVEDMKTAIDATVLKKGVFNLVFHPHGWIKSEQVVELIDHAAKTHGRKVKFLNFREAQERIDRNLLDGQPLRAEDGGDNGVRLLDVDGDGFMDVTVGNAVRRETRVWLPKDGRWETADFPLALVQQDRAPSTRPGVRFGVVRGGGRPSVIVRDGEEGAWTFDGRRWASDPSLLRGLDIDGGVVRTAIEGRDGGVRLRDIDGDGRCELIVGADGKGAVFSWSDDRGAWSRRPFGLPGGTSLVREGRDAGLRFLDLDEDGRLDVVSSNDEGSSIHLFDSPEKGWSRRVPADPLPKIVRGGEDNGFWAHSRHLWWQNEETAGLPEFVDRRSINELLKEVEPRARTPEASRASIRVHPGFRVELVASEPLVRDPVAFDWGADGRLWVVEMGDYPLGGDGKGKPVGVVKRLEDADGDGSYDRATVFLDGLSFPTGVMPWSKGVLIACAPDILYAEDRDGDGRADVREVLFTGFVPGNPQHRMNGFELGLDGWVYGANGDSGGRIRSTRTGKTVNISGRDFRFRPDDGRFEAESGQTQFGRHRDDWGHWFGNNNSVWGWYYALSDRDLARNPAVAIGQAKAPLGVDGRLYPISRTLPRFNFPGTEGQVTSANSPTPYRDSLFGPAFADALFVSEPVHNLVRRIRLEPDGVAFRGRLADDEAGREFLASTDNWFRPAMLKTGPDGALWIADMYRAVIEHPEWIPDDWEARIDLRAGHDLGRIYRVVPVHQPPRPIDRLDRLDVAGLVAALDSPNGWRRDTAQRLLLHSADASAIGPLRTLATTSDRPQTRVQALGTLQALGGVDAGVVEACLAHAHPEVRRAAARAGEEMMAGSPGIGAAIARLTDDAEIRVRMQAALSLGRWPDPEAGKALARILLRDAGDPWVRPAALISAKGHAATILASLFSEPAGRPAASVVEPLFAQALADGPGGLAPLIRSATEPVGGRFSAWQFAAVGGLLDAAARAGKSWADVAGPDAQRIEALPAAARRSLADDRADAELRHSAARFLGRRGPIGPEDRDALASLLRPQAPPSLQAEGVRALAHAGGADVPRLLLAGWAGHSPSLRAAILDTLLSREAWGEALLAAAEAGAIAPGDIGPGDRERLLRARSAPSRDRAAALFVGARGPRADVIARYRDAMPREGDPKAGMAVFRKNCAACHRLGGEGAEVGPDLSTITDRSDEVLLTAVLDPNRAFEARFTTFLIATADGRTLSGIVASETAASITLLRQDGQGDIVPRSEIAEMTSSGKSLMPEGLEETIPPRDLADLFAALRAAGPPPRTIPGNRPERVGPGPDGAILLKAQAAEIRGPNLTLEPTYHNLGYWTSAEDRAAWEFQVERPGRYEVELEWACDDSSANNAYLLDFGASRIAGKVAGTGSWDAYRWQKVGGLDLASGTHRLEVRPAGPIRTALFDLRTIRLRPAAAADGRP
ncbi:PVC-type heme-binding CxxCH protein [Tundrisphaera sp. TA3]|uniref:PVC-type heme-binding CxxCH protein n=1 Tax=Tundrisphaera sp. TA3 TaxID=3435775 RepID=UPI003EBF8369